MNSLKEKREYTESLPLKPDNVIKIEKYTFFQRIHNFKSNITVEPVLFGGILASMISTVAVQNLNLDKACRVSKQYGDQICDALINRRINSTEHEVAIQHIISSIEAWRTVIHTVLPILVIIFMGAWSDRTGDRKCCLLLPIFGEILVNVSNMLSTFFFDAVSVEVTMVLESLLPAMTGRWMLLLTGAITYVCDVTPEETRTYRLGLVTLCMSTGIPVGMSLSGLLLKFSGYYGVFSIAAGINAASFLYGYYALSNNTTMFQKGSMKFVDLITMQKETFAVIFKNRKGNYRIKIILTVIVATAVFAYDHGEEVVIYLFLRYRLNWDAFTYSIFSTQKVIMNSLGTLFAITFLSRRWGWHDTSLCLLGALVKLVGSVYIVFVQTDLQMFILPIIVALHEATYPAMRSMASKLVPATELGKMNSLVSLTGTAGTLLLDPVYSSLYAATVESFTAAIFVLSGVMTLPVLAVLLWCFKQHRRESR